MDDINIKIDWLTSHLRYTQALCEIIIENLPETEKSVLIGKVHERVREIELPFYG